MFPHNIYQFIKVNAGICVIPLFVWRKCESNSQILVIILFCVICWLSWFVYNLHVSCQLNVHLFVTYLTYSLYLWQRTFICLFTVPLRKRSFVCLVCITSYGMLNILIWNNQCNRFHYKSCDNNRYSVRPMCHIHTLLIWIM